jgi:hypothetical protein
MANLSIGAIGGDVARLHQQLKDSGFDVPPAEVSRRTFGPGTREALRRYQRQRGLPLSGEVDDRTKAALTTPLLDPGTTAMLTADVERRIADRLRGLTPRIPPPGGPVPPGGPAPPAPPASPATTVEYKMEGRVVLEHGLPATGLQLRLYQRGFGGIEKALQEVKTDATGRYTAAYKIAEGTANVELRAVVGQKEIPLSKTRFGAAQTDRLNVVAPSAVQPLAAEYTRLTADLTEQLGDLNKLADARENDERRDLSVLNRATGWDARLIALAATAHGTSADASIGLGPDVLYALFRAGLPTDKPQLSRVSTDAVGKALTRARNAGIVRLSDAQIEQAKTRFGAFATEAQLSAVAPGSRSTYRELLTASGLAADRRDKFAAVYLRNRGDAAQLWKSAAEAGLTAPEVQALQVQGKLAYLTGNNNKVMARLRTAHQVTDPVRLVDRDLFEADAWKAEIRAVAGAATDAAIDAVIPPAYAGASTADRLNAYAGDMARKVRLGYPTHVVGRMIERDRTDSFRLGTDRNATVTLLKNAARQGFRFGETPVGAFMARHPGVRGGLNNQAFGSAVRELKTLQRVYQISPGNEEMAILLQLGLTSAYDVVAVPLSVFLDLYGSKFPSIEQARIVYRKAQQVTSVTYNLFTIARKLDTDVPLFGMSAPAEVRDTVRNELIKQFPTMESLFGSMDYCECEHCRSVLSPAAYLVDLLQFIDPDQAVWDGFLSRWKDTHGQAEYTARYKNPYAALTTRRPDLANIPLTCANTNTAMPYIDLVNEILEYYVANGRVEAAAANDTGTATTAELLAEPQNVIRLAYDRLRTAKYPLTLPFDLWLETVRGFCDFFETPFADVLEAFRPSDALFAGGQVHDRAAIFAEVLRLSAADVAIFTNADPLPTWHQLYGFDTAAHAMTVATDATTKQRIDLNSAKALARRLGVTYEEITGIVKTGFVNPSLVKLTILHKLGVSIGAVRLANDAQNQALYNQNKDLIGKERDALSAADQARFDALTSVSWQILNELQAFNDRVTAFVAQSGLSRDEVTAALQAIPFDRVLVLVDADAGCDFDATTLRYASGRAADAIAFLRINLFVRLWRRLGWTIEETDRALQAFVPANAPFDTPTLNKQPLKTALMYLVHLNVLDAKVKVGKGSRQKLLTLWSDIATTGENALYQQLFLTRAMLKTDDVFDHPLGEYLTVAAVARKAQSRVHVVQKEGVPPAQRLDPAAFASAPALIVAYDPVQQVQHLSYRGVLTDADKPGLLARSSSAVLAGLLDAVQAKARDFSLVKGHLIALEGALGLTADDVQRILADANTSLDAAELSLANVSLLYRYGLLAKALKLTPRELIALKQLTGLAPFMSLRADSPTTVDEDAAFSQTLRFVDIVAEVKASGLKVEDLQFLLRHQFDEVGKYRPNSAATRALLTTLAAGIRAIRAEHRVPDDPASTTDDVLRSKLGLVLAPDVVEQFLAMMAGTAEFTATRTGVAAADQLRSEGFDGETAVREVRYNATRQEAKLTFRGVLFGTEKAAMLARLPRPTPSTAHVPSAVLSALLDDVEAQARAFFAKFLRKTAPNAQPAGGFLADADFDLLFAAPAAGLTELQLQEHVRRQRKRLNEAFLPYLQQRLIRQLVVGTMTAQSAAEPSLVERLVTDARLIGETGPAGAVVPLLQSLVDIGEPGVSVTFFASTDGTGAPLSTAVIPSADTGLKDSQGNPVRPAAARSALLDMYVEVPASGAYRFFILVDRQATSAELRFEHLPSPVLVTGVAASDNAVFGTNPAEFVELKAGVPYRVTLNVRNIGTGNARLLVQGETLPRDSVAQLLLYPQTALVRAERTIQRLTKSLQLIGALGLSEREVSYVTTHAAAFGGVDLKALPARAEDDSVNGAQGLFAWFLRLAVYARLKRELAPGTDDLIGIFEANGAGDIERVYGLLATVMRRDATVVKATARALWAAPSFDSEKPLARLVVALQIVERFGVPVASLVEWTRIVAASTTPDARFAIARDLKETVKARFDGEAWQRVAQPIFDKLRQRQRDALVAYIMQQARFDRIEQLYEYFLIDPAMEPVVQTSRIRLAIASVQLFVQRCLLNLEKDVHPTAIINAEHWEWMKRYRVWEANRKIFLFPENWLEPEFRDDKTHLYAELEGLLLQGDLSRDLVEDAFLTYLRKLEQLARLQIVAMHLEDNADPARNTLHVFGRTYSDPHDYYYRRYVHQAWTPWEPVAAKIEGNHLAPVFWRGRPYLFWVTFVEQPAPNTALRGPKDNNNNEKKVTDITLSQLSSSMGAVNASVRVEVRLHWTEYVNGEWSGQEEAVAGTVRLNSPFVPNNVFVHVSKEPYENGEERGVIIHLHGAINLAFRLAGRNSLPESDNPGPIPVIPFVHDSRHALGAYYRSTFAVTLRERVSTDPSKSTPAGDQTILSHIRRFSLVPCDNEITLGVVDPATIGGDNPQAVATLINGSLAEIEALLKPVFYQDNATTLFVEPFVTERTLEGWDEWVTRTPTADPRWDDDDWFEDVVIEPKIPRDIDPPPDVDPESLILPTPREDWLVNPKTALVFDGALIHTTGRTSFEMQPAIYGESRAGDVLAHPASDAGAGTVIVSTDRENTRLREAFGGSGVVTIVGSGGLNAGLRNNARFDRDIDARTRG